MDLADVQVSFKDAAGFGSVQMFAGRAPWVSEYAPELTAEVVVDGALPSQPVISPDGCWVAYVVAPVGRRAERRICALGLAAADGGSPPGELTAGMGGGSGRRGGGGR